MSKHLNIGVWLDHRAAQLVELNDGDVKHTEIESDVERHTKSTGGTKLGGRPQFGAADSSERRLNERRQHEIRNFFDRVKAALTGADQIAILGSGIAKDEFARYLEENNGLHERVVSVEACKPLTKGQLVALVKERFHQPSPRNAIR